MCKMVKDDEKQRSISKSKFKNISPYLIGAFIAFFVMYAYWFITFPQFNNTLYQRFNKFAAIDIKLTREQADLTFRHNHKDGLYRITFYEPDRTYNELVEVKINKDELLMKQTYTDKGKKTSYVERANIYGDVIIWHGAGYGSDIYVGNIRKNRFDGRHHWTHGTDIGIARWDMVPINKTE